VVVLDLVSQDFIYLFIYFVLQVLGFELWISYLLGRCLPLELGAQFGSSKWESSKVLIESLYR
jgi:hypothetical protein